MPRYLLTGVDGNLSSIAATYALTLSRPDDQLIFTSPKPGHIPRSLLDSWTKAGAQTLMVDYDDWANLVRAFRGADAVAFVSSPDYLAGKRRRTQHQNVIEAAKAAGVRRLVYTSLVGAEDGEGKEGDVEVPALARDHAYTERLIRESGMVWNIQRNYLFVETMAEILPSSPSLHTAESKAAFVAREDCGRVLGALLMDKGEPNQVYTITGPKAVTGREVLEWMTSLPDSPVSPKEENAAVRWRERRLSDSWGRPTGIMTMDDVLALRRLVTSGYLAGETDAVARLTGRNPLGFEASLAGGDSLD